MRDRRDYVFIFRNTICTFDPDNVAKYSLSSKQTGIKRSGIGAYYTASADLSMCINKCFALFVCGHYLLIFWILLSRDQTKMPHIPVKNMSKKRKGFSTLCLVE